VPASGGGFTRQMRASEPGRFGLSRR